VRELVEEATAERDRLASARAARRSYLADLASRQALTGQAIERLTSQASAAEAKAASLPASGGGSGNPAPAPAPTPAPTIGSGTQMTVAATGYCLQGTTATGIPTGWGVVAVDPAVIPLGTRMSIPGYGEGVAADTGSAVRGATIDVWFPQCSQALAWGRKVVTITLL
jgi:3D (Asp-Asp-Asp) domain-containing protein